MKRFLKISIFFVPHGFPEEKLGLFNLAGTQALLSSFLQFCFSLRFFSVRFRCGHVLLQTGLCSASFAAGGAVPFFFHLSTADLQLEVYLFKEVK